MVRVIVALIATLIVGCATAGSLDYSRQKARYDAWHVACMITEYNCVGLRLPDAEFTNLRPGLYGRYQGGNTIIISRDLYGLRLKETLLHETIHYLQVKVGGLKVPGYPEYICPAEEEAFTLVDKWLDSIGAGWLKSGKYWWLPYRHCYQFYAPRSYRWIL